MNSITKRLEALEVTHNRTGGARQPTLAHWRMFNDGDTAGLPGWAVDILQQRREQARQMWARVLEDFSDENNEPST